MTHATTMTIMSHHTMIPTWIERSFREKDIHTGKAKWRIKFEMTNIK